MSIRKVSLLSLAGLFFILAIATVGVAKKELSATMRAPLWGAETSLGPGIKPPLAYSIRADYASIDTCLHLTNSVSALLLPSSERLKRAQWCQNLAKKILETSKYNAYAWFALANFAHISGQAKLVNQALEQSYGTGPNEQWIAEQRVPLAEERVATLSDAALQGHLRDLAVLTQSKRGIRAIAHRYLRDPDFRGRITNIVENLPTEDQRRFLRVLQREVRGD